MKTVLLLLVLAVLLMVHAMVGPPEGDEGPEDKPEKDE